MHRFQLVKNTLIVFTTLVMALAGSSQPAGAALKDQINISGTAADASGNPLSGNYLYWVRFFDAATGGTQIGTDIYGSADLTSEGVFNIAVTPPAEAATRDSVWYELALDTDGNGIDANDVFGGRVPIHSVPFAQNAGLLDGQAGSYYLDAGNLTGTIPSLSLNLTDSDIPDDITILSASQAQSATQASSATNALLLDGQAPGYYLDAGNLTGTVPALSLNLTDSDIPDDITINQAANADSLGGTPAADYSTEAELAAALALKSDVTHTHQLQDLAGTQIALINQSATPSMTADILYQLNDNLYWQGFKLNTEPMDVDVAPNVSGDYRISSDTVVVGSLGVGQDMSAGLDFVFDTIVLKENNLRILFDDTSSSGSFPRNDWRLVANDSANGGRSYFGIEDVTHNIMPFYIGENAEDASLVVRKDTGYVGIHNARPEGLLDVLIRGAAEVADSNSTGGSQVTGGLIAQSITAATGGNLDRVVMDVDSVSGGVTSLELRVYSGNDPTTGSLIKTIRLTDLPVFPASVTFDFSKQDPPVTFTAGENYVLELYSFAVDAITMPCSTVNPYSGGQAYTKQYAFSPDPYTSLPGTDILFETYIQDSSGFAPGFFVSSEGRVGINTKTPEANLDIAGVARIEATPSAPAVTTDRLYNVAGNLYWNGRVLDSNPSVDKGQILDSGTLGFEWSDSEISDSLTVTGMATLTGTETLSNKTLTDPAVNAGGGSITLPQGTDVSGNTAEGRMSWDSDDDKLYVGNGSSAVEIGAGGGGGTVVDTITASFTELQTADNNFTIWKQNMKHSGTIVSIQVYCADNHGAGPPGDIDVRKNGSSIISSGATLTEGVVVEPTITTSAFAFGDALSLYFSGIGASSNNYQCTITIIVEY